MKTKNKEKGFTLIELLVVVAIIGLLSSIVLASLSGARSKARDTKRVGEMRSIENALTLYSVANNGGVPTSAYTSWGVVPRQYSNGPIDCAAVDTNNQELYTILINAKALSSRPAPDPQAAQGYCYVYISNTSLGYKQSDIKVAGASYDQEGYLISSGPLAANSTPVGSAAFFTALENTKTTSNSPAFVGITFGNNPPFVPNKNLTTGVNSDVRYTY